MTRQPLTEKQINAIVLANKVFGEHPGAIHNFVRAIEQAHGVGSESQISAHTARIKAAHETMKAALAEIDESKGLSESACSLDIERGSL